MSGGTYRDVLDLLGIEALNDPQGSVTASFVSAALRVDGKAVLSLLLKAQKQGFLTLVHHDVCEYGHVNEDVLEKSDNDSVAYCPACGRDERHQRYLVYRFTSKLLERPIDPKDLRRRAPLIRSRASIDTGCPSSI